MSIPDYGDANDKDRACRYKLAKDAASILEYTTVLDLLSGVPDDYKDVGSLRAEAAYQKAKTAIKQQDWAAAAELLGSVDRSAVKRKYRDIENLYLEACKNAGIEPNPGTPEPSAAPEEGTPSPAPTSTPESPFLVTED